MKNIILIGMPGCGKTTIGKLLAERLGLTFFDSDNVFSERVHPSISEFFKTHGEDEFRREETKILRYLSQKSNCIIATGGGVVERTENKEILKSGGTVVFINRSPEDIVSDVDTASRPLLADGKEKIFALYEKRIPKYLDFCDVEIKNQGRLPDLVNKIIDEVNSYNE